MTEAKFTELINLYLDKEISEESLAELKEELAANPERKTEFRERCRLHQAMRLAMAPNKSRKVSGRTNRAGRSNRSGRSGRSSGSSRSSATRNRVTASADRRSTAGSGARSSSRGRGVDGGRKRSNSDSPAFNGSESADDGSVRFPRWILLGGVAACFLLGLLLLPPVFRDTTSAASQPALVGVSADELLEEDPLDSIGRAELRRYASMQEQRASNRHANRASLAAQFRLMGLRPELTPEMKELRPVDVAASQTAASAPRSAVFGAASLDDLQKMTPMPEFQILRAGSSSVEPAARWPGGFQSSLVGFK